MRLVKPESSFLQATKSPISYLFSLISSISSVLNHKSCKISVHQGVDMHLYVCGDLSWNNLLSLRSVAELLRNDGYSTYSFHYGTLLDQHSTEAELFLSRIQQSKDIHVLTSWSATKYDYENWWRVKTRDTAPY